MLKKIALRIVFWSLILVPIALAAVSPLLQWRELPYILAGFAGVMTLPIILVQLVARTQLVSTFFSIRSRDIHRVAGVALLLAVIIHVVGLGFTSPPDVVDSLLFRAPALFSYFGTLALLALILTTLLTALRALGLMKAKVWSLCHKALGMTVVLCGSAHALLIEGTMEPLSKWVICTVIVVGVVVIIWFPKRMRSLR